MTKIERQQLLQRMRRRLTTQRAVALRRGYKPPAISPDNALRLWFSQKNRCGACRGKLTFKAANLDHNHETGEARAFTCRRCNLAEGFLKNLKGESRNRYLGFIWPDLRITPKPGAKVKIIVVVPRPLLDKINRSARQARLDRSQYLCRAAEILMQDAA